MLRFQAGDEAAFEELVERCKQTVLNLTYRFMGGTQDAEDIAQEVFLRVYRAKDRYQPTAKFITWLYVICRNVCFKELKRRKSRHAAIPMASDPDGAADLRHVPDGRGASPVAELLYNEQATLVKRAVDALPETQRMALLLRRYDRLSYEDIAAVLGTTVKAVKSLLHRARTTLKDELAEYLDRTKSPRDLPLRRGFNTVKGRRKP